jgi:release factor glutamine methyltransferase
MPAHKNERQGYGYRVDTPQIVATLRAAGCVFAEEEAGLLAGQAAGPDELARMLAERAAGQPLEQVLGWARFCGARIAVRPGVFVPRRRTEFLARQAISLTRPGGVVLDLCCGTAAVGVAVALTRQGTRLHAVDIDPAAVACARENLAGLGAVHQGDLYAALPPSLRGGLDVIVCNAPYVPSGEIALMPPEARDHEPRRALDGGHDGLDVQRRVVLEAGEWLRLNGYLLMETSRRQAFETLRTFGSAGFSAHVVTSEELDATVVIGTLSVRGQRGGLPAAG